MLLYRTMDEGIEVEVRRFDSTTELWRDGVLHTSYSSEEPVTGDVWDCLALPSILLPTPPQRVLILGLGGGAALNLLSKYQHCPSIVAVDLSPVCIDIFDRFFRDCDLSSKITLVHNDARSFVESYKGPAFDYVIDDVFCEDDDGEPIRAIEFDEEWYGELCQVMTAESVLVANFGDSDERMNSCLSELDFDNSRENGLVLRSTESLNEIVALTEHQASPRKFWGALQGHPVWGSREAKRGLTVKTRALR